MLSPNPSAPPSDPSIPAELWGLWNRREDGFEHWVPTLDVPDCDSILVCLSEADAEAAAAYHNERYDLQCRPVRLK